MTRFVFFSLGDLPQQTTHKGHKRRQIRFDTADHHLLHIRIAHGFHNRGIKLGMIHTEDDSGARVFELVMQLRRRVKGVAGHAGGTRFRDTKKDLREMGQVG